jgi:hypothetical protein
MGKTLEIAVHDDFTVNQAFWAELFGTMVLAHTILVVGEIKNTTKLSPALSVATTLTMIALAVGYISGGAFNPAVGFGIDIVDACNHDGDRFENTWIYFLGPLMGGMLAPLGLFLFRPALQFKKSSTRHKTDITADYSNVVPPSSECDLPVDSSEQNAPEESEE